MKRILVLLLFMLTLILTTVKADDETGISKRVKESFKKEFPGARLVKWERPGEYQVVTFCFNNNRVEAYFNSGTGELEGYARYIIIDQLPTAVIKSFDKLFTITDFINILEISNTEGTFYQVMGETKGRKYAVRISANGKLLGKLKIKQ